MKYLLYCSVVFLCFATSCKHAETHGETQTANYTTNTSHVVKDRQLSEAFKAYWYAGNAEITSYKLSQERYGELREGTAVNIFVTEDFLPEAQVKADRASSNNIPVLKLNQTKKYVTGIYPYSVMTSTFTPTTTANNAIKISHSMQEWCGHIYAQLNNRNAFEITQHSYFEGEADTSFTLDKVALESDIWNLIRINPAALPIGTIEMLPSFEYFRMSHHTLEAQNAITKLEQGDTLSTYTIRYPDIKRTLQIHFNKKFPHTIERWEEIHANGLITSAKKIKRMKTAYWGQNSTKFESLRDSLGLQ